MICICLTIFAYFFKLFSLFNGWKLDHTIKLKTSVKSVHRTNFNEVLSLGRQNIVDLRPKPTAIRAVHQVSSPGVGSRAGSIGGGVGPPGRPSNCWARPHISWFYPDECPPPAYSGCSSGEADYWRGLRRGQAIVCLYRRPPPAQPSGLAEPGWSWDPCRTNNKLNRQ